MLALALAAAVWAWMWGPAGRPAPRPNILLVTIDTLRADAVGAYGKSGTPTPLIDRLAAAGVRFSNAYAHNVVTLPSHANILTGDLPPVHRVRDNGGFRLEPDVETLATHLRRLGYRTGAFVSAFPLDSRFGLASGFDVYDDRLAGGPATTFLIQERPAERTVALAKTWIDAAGGEPWFAWVHLYEPHYPYEAPARFASRWPDDPYLGEVAAADAALAPLVAPILAAGAESGTLVIVTSDHGEALGDHGEASHGIFAYESVLRVPLILHATQMFGPRVVNAPARHVDLLPTVLDVLALPPTARAGRSLAPDMTGIRPDADTTVYFEALSASLTRGWAPLFGIIQDGYKYIELPMPELYDLRDDPGEAHNLIGSDPERTARLRARLDNLRREDPGPAPWEESAEVRERLGSLGYVTGGATPPAGAYTEDDDPKRLIALDAILQEVLERYLAGDLAGALTRSRDLVRRRPSMAVAWMQLGQLEREAGNAAGAVEALERAVALNPRDSAPVVLLAASLTEAGRAQQAVDLLEQPAGEPDADPDLLAARALALARLARFDDALAELARARERKPSNALLLVQTGTVHL